MTVIVGIETSTGIAMGADSGSYGSRGSVTITLHPSDPKIFFAGDFLVGVAGSARFSNVLQHCVKWPTVPKPRKGNLVVHDQDLMRFMVTVVVPRIRAACKRNDLELRPSGGLLEDDNDDTGEALLGVLGRLFLLENDFHVERSGHRYNAIGVGAPVAMGSLYTSGGTCPNEDRILDALEAAMTHCPYVRKPWTILEK
jgi:hypothetical protein